MQIKKTPSSAVVAVDVPRDYELGPAMSKLNERQQAFVMAMVQLGGSQKRSALAAGYKDNPDSPKSIEVTAFRLAHDAKIQDAIQEVCQKMMRAGAIPALKFLLDMLEDETVEKKDRAKVALSLMDRTGLHATSEHKVAVEYKDESTEELLKRVGAMAERLGIDPQKLLGSAVIMDAVFEEIKDDDLTGLYEV